jgi:hypothetical protein
MIRRYFMVGVLTLLAGCGTTPSDRTQGGAAGGAATGATIGLIGGPIGVAVGAVIGGGAGALTGASTNAQDLNLGSPPWSDAQ